ncbi:MAG: hypothetical protein H6811_07540 [Phycisphaeraceae bacterium]|nr:hypothetical protein [Phycisphaeraceae bacterium]
MSEQNTSMDPRDGAGAMLRMLSGTTMDAAASAASAARKRLVTTYVLLAGVAVLSGVAIFTMRTMGVRAGMRSDDTKVTYKGESISAEQARRFEVVLATLERGGAPLQVPQEMAGTDPFYLTPADTDAVDENADQLKRDAERIKAEQAARNAAEARKREIENTLAGLVLQTVVTGRVPLATINDTIVRPGDTVLDLFTVADINHSGVVLEVDGQTYTITTSTHGPGVRRSSGKR